MLRRIININHTLDCDEDLSPSDVVALVAQHLATAEVVAYGNTDSDTVYRYRIPEFIILSHTVTNIKNEPDDAEHAFTTVHNIIVEVECK